MSRRPGQHQIVTHSRYIFESEDIRHPGFVEFNRCVLWPQSPRTVNEVAGTSHWAINRSALGCSINNVALTLASGKYKGTPRHPHRGGAR